LFELNLMFLLFIYYSHDYAYGIIIIIFNVYSNEEGVKWVAIDSQMVLGANKVIIS
jgi:hypothetical protein